MCIFPRHLIIGFSSFNKQGVHEMPYKQTGKLIEIECVWDCTLRQEKAELLRKQRSDIDHQETQSSEPVFRALWLRT